MFSIFKSSKRIEVNFSDFLEQDMHSHILPGIDDGALDLETSIALIKGMQKAGIKFFLGTPHIMSDIHRNNRQTITSAFEILKTRIQELNLDIKLNFGAEYMIDDGFPNLIASKDMLTIFDNYILIETPFYKEPLDIEEVLFQIETNGYNAILAHPERYHYVDDNLKVFEKYLDRGMTLQLNILALSGYYGSREKEIANKMLDAGYYSFTGTDLHHERHLNRISSMVLDKKVIQKIEQTNWQNHKISKFYQNK